VPVVNYLIMQAPRHGASDIHLEPSRKHTSVRFRVDGQLREVLRPRRDLHPAIVSRIKVMARMDIAEHRLPQDGRAHALVEGHQIDLRISVLPTVLGEKVVIRVLDRRRLSFNLDTLGFSNEILRPFKQLLSKPYGLLLVTGPTGSGKTTTLYSAIELIKSVPAAPREEPLCPLREAGRGRPVHLRPTGTLAMGLPSVQARAGGFDLSVGRDDPGRHRSGHRAGRHRPAMP